MKKVISLLICIILVATSFSGCSDKEENINFIFPINGEISSYDPQIASTADEFVLIENTFEGLIRVLDDGTIQNGVAESWDISDDGLTYQFNLKHGLKWRINDPIKERMGEEYNPEITAHDFAFALKRAVAPETASPLFPTIACIKNAVQINSGTLGLDWLGVEARDDYTLVITLESPNDDFMNVLSSSIAMPCNEDFFNKTNGRYGLQGKYTLFNGQFYLKQVLESSYLLKNNPDYSGEFKSLAKELTLKIVNDENRKDTFNLIEKGYYDAAFISGSDSKKIKQNSGVTYIPYIDTTWGFVFNCNDEIFQNIKMREAFCLGISRSDEYEEEYLTNATSFAPPSCKIGTKEISSIVNNSYLQDNSKSMELWNEGLKKLDNPQIDITIITTQNMESTVKKLIQGVQSGIGSISSYDNDKPMKFTLKVEILTQSELDSRVASKDFDIAFCPFKAESSSAISFYSEFANDNKPGFDTTKLNNLITSANSYDSSVAEDSIVKCEEEITNSHSVYPVIFESSYYTCGKDIENIQFHPGTGRVSFVNATKK